MSIEVTRPSPAVVRRFATTLFLASPRRAAMTALLTIGVGLFEGVGLLLLIPLLQLIGLDAQHGGMGRLMAVVRHAFDTVGVAVTLPRVLLLYVAVIALQSVVQRWQAIVSAALRRDLVDLLRGRLYRAVAGTSWLYFSRHRASLFLQILTSKVDRVASAAYYLIDLVVTLVISLVYIAMAVRVSATMTAAVVAGGLLLALVFRGRLREARALGADSGAASTRLYAATSDFLESMKLAKGYGAEDRHAGSFAGYSSALSQKARAEMRAGSRTRQWLAIGSAAMLAFMVYLATSVMAMPPASIFLLMFLFARLVPRLTSLYDKAQSLAGELPEFELVAVAEAQALAAAEPRAAEHREIALSRALDLRSVMFSYSESRVSPALIDVTLSCAARTTTAIVGPSGAGKSTIADLLLGLIQPLEGHVLVDGAPLSAEVLRAWRAQIGYVPQETLLFHDTVLANLRWAKPDATDDEIWHALTLAAAADFVRGLPEGLHTVLGDRGVLISGGERQRLALARALVRKPRLLILDEATSSLDSENEQRIQEAIERLHEQITIVVITHRLSTIRNVDLIHVVDGGRVVESGTWDALISSSGRFRALCRAQGLEAPAAPLPL